MTRPQIVIAGGGYVGLYAARGLERALSPDEADVTLVSPRNYMLYQPLLPEVASGALEPRHAVVPLRTALRRTQVVTGRLAALDTSGRRAVVSLEGTDRRTLAYTQCVVALGSMTKVLPVPGVVDQAVGFTSLAEAVDLRNRILRALETAQSRSGAARRRALTFVFVGGGYTGVEALAELRELAVGALRAYPGLSADDLRFVLLEASDRLLPNLTRALADDALAELRRQRVEVRLSTQVQDATDGVLRLGGDDGGGDVLETDTLVWMAGVVPNTIDGSLGLPTDEEGRIVVDDRLRVQAVPGVWSGGDCAAVPDLVAGGTCPPTAQYAVREGRRLARNIAAVLRGREPAAFRYHNKGSFVALGRGRGVADLMGRPLRGMPAWLARRGYYATQVPTVNRKARVVLDWAAGAPFGRDVVDLGSGQEAGAVFATAARRQLAPE